MGRRPAPASRARWWPSSRSTSTTSSTWCARPPTPASCGATSRTRRCCSCRRCTGTAARSDVMVMERMHGTPISAASPSLRAQGIDIPQLARAGRRDLLHARCSATASSTPTCTPATSSSRADGPLHRARLRHHGHAHRQRQELPRAELHGVLQPRLPPRRAGARRGGLGAAATRASTSSRPRSARCASRSSTGR